MTSDNLRPEWPLIPLCDALIVLRNGLNCAQVADGNGDAISRIETIASGKINLGKVGRASLSQAQKAKFQLLSGDILFSHINSPPHVGKSAIINELEEPLYHGVNLLLLRPHPNVDPRFLQFFLQRLHAEGYWRSRCKQSVNQASVNQQDLSRVVIPLPPLEEQKRIVAVLDQAFAALDRARALAEANLANAEALLFQTVEAALYALGEPQPIGRHVDLLSGFAFKSGGYTDDPEDVRLIRGDNIVQGAFRWDGVKRWPKGKRSVYARYELAADDVLIAMDRTWVSAGIKYAVVDEGALPSLLVQRVARLRTKSTLLPSFLAICIGSKLFERYVLDIQTGLGVPHVSGKQLEAFEVPIPDLDAQRNFVERIEAVRGRSKALTANLQASLSDIADLRRSLLQKAFAGELT